MNRRQCTITFWFFPTGYVLKLAIDGNTTDDEIPQKYPLPTQYPSDDNVITFCVCNVPTKTDLSITLFSVVGYSIDCIPGLIHDLAHLISYPFYNWACFSLLSDKYHKHRQGYYFASETTLPEIMVPWAGDKIKLCVDLATIALFECRLNAQMLRIPCIGCDPIQQPIVALVFTRYLKGQKNSILHYTCIHNTHCLHSNSPQKNLS